MAHQRALQVEAAERRLPVVQLSQPVPDVTEGVGTPVPGPRHLRPDLAVHQSGGDGCRLAEPDGGQGVNGLLEVTLVDELARLVHRHQLGVSAQSVLDELGDERVRLDVVLARAVGDGRRSEPPHVAAPSDEAVARPACGRPRLLDVDEEEQLRQAELGFGLALPHAVRAEGASHRAQRLGGVARQTGRPQHLGAVLVAGSGVHR